jgi:Ca2+/H+ antiporter, TMEM165/GDT1 family
MKIDRRRIPLALFLLASVLVCEAAPSNSLSSDSDSRDSRLPRDTSESAVGSRAAPVGTEHAPVDGKDGMPHEGPWVQTESERKKQKLKDSSDEEEVPVLTKKTTTSPTGLPQSNDGVMDDRNRKSPQAGTRGTEGGVSEKSKDGNPIDKKPEQPKEVPPLPHSEKEKMKSADGDDGNEEEVTVEVETKKPYTVCPESVQVRLILTSAQVPTDLPAKSHDIPYPENPSSPKDNTITPDKPTTSKPDGSASDHEPAVISPIHSLLLSFTMILFSEIGDKTFLVAALMAMRHDRVVVFTAAYSALITMTVLSAVLGHAVPTLISPHITNFLAAGLFLVFGVRMLLEARKISPDEGVSEEMKEVEMELEEKEHAAARRQRRRSSVSPYILESGRAPRTKHKTHGRSLPSPPSSPSSSGSRSSSPSRVSSLRNSLDGLSNLFSLLLSPAWVQTFVMTFLGEWGDRSQIATIAMAAGQDYWWVTAGALGGHAICTGVAVLGGKAIAGKVSLRTVTMGGAIAFLVFGGIYALEAVY